MSQPVQSSTTNDDARSVVSDTLSQDSNAPPSAIEPKNSSANQLASSYVHDGGVGDSGAQSSLGSGDDGIVFGDGLYLERLVPNTLDPESRAMYCEALWNGFSDRASHAGLITMEQTLELIEELRLDTGAEGDEAWLLQHMMTNEELDEGLTYHRVMEIFDDLGKRVNGEYLAPQGAGGARGGDGPRGGEPEGGEGDVIQVGPLEYLKILFRRGRKDEKQSQHQSSKMGGSTSVSSQDRWERATYKLVFFKSAEVSPRQLLLISTGALMIALCAALITGIAVQWSTTALAREEVALQGFHRSIKLLFEGIENSILQDHSNGMVEQATALARYLEFEVNERKQFTAERNTQIAMKLSELGVFEDAFALENSMRNQLAAQVLSDFAELRATHIDYRGRADLLLQQGNLSAVLDTTGCLQESTGRGFGFTAAATLMWEKAVLLWKEARWNNDTSAAGVDPQPSAVRWCGIPTNDSVRSALDRALATTISSLTPVLSLNSSEGYMALLSGDSTPTGDNNDSSLASINSTRTSVLLSSQDCSDADGNFTCGRLLGNVSLVIESRAEQNLTFPDLQTPMHWRGIIDAFDGTERMWGASIKPLDPFISSLSSSGIDYSLTILVGTQKKQMLDKRRHQIVQTTDYLNRNFNRSTEIVIALWNETNNQAIRQATDYRFSDGCLIPGQCVRFDPSATNILAAFRTQSYGWSLTPDYRPEPVSGAYSYIGAELNAAIVFERDVLEMRGIAFDFITSIINAVNRANPGSLEIELVGEERSPHMKQFYAYEPCPVDVTDCEVDPRGMSPANGSAGVLFQYNCRHCQRVTTKEFGDTVIWQEPKFATGVSIDASTTTPNAKRRAPQLYSQVLESELSPNRGSFLDRTSDYRGTVVLLALDLLENFTTLIGAKVDVEEIQRPILNAVGISVGCGLLFLVLGMTLLIVLSQRAFNAFEAEWFRYKQQIEEEQHKFAELVHGIIPPFIAERLMKGPTIIADPPATCCFIFTDICNLHETTSSWTPIQVARFVTYTMTVLDEIASECALTKLRSIGGCHVCVGHKDERDQKAQVAGAGKQSTEASEMRSDPPGTSFLTHPACRGVRFASLAMILVSKLFTHTPWKVDALHEAFLVDYTANGRKVRKSSTMMPLEMPTLRIGIHCGPAISGAFTIGKTSHYDFYGMNPSLAHRMLQSAPPGRIHCTSAVKELVRAHDAPDQVHYEFEAAKKLVVRGQGTVATFFARSLGEKVPPRILSALGISESELVVDLTRSNGLNLRRRRAGDRSSSSSERSGGLYRGRADSKKRKQ
jgi:class 3 adenylate cyclase